MTRRQSKKLHRRYLDDVLSAVRASSYWRRRLFESEAGLFVIDRHNTLGLDPEIRRVIARYSLSYRVRPGDEDSLYDIVEEKGSSYLLKRFLLEAGPFPGIRRQSAPPARRAVRA